MTDRFAPEMQGFTDPMTGRAVVRLTGDSGSNNVHFYFTENSFVPGDREIYFISDRETAPVYNVFHMDLVTGEMRRLTRHLPPERTGFFTKNPSGSLVLYNAGQRVMMLDTEAQEARCLYTVPEGWRCGRISLNCRETQVGVLLNEDVGWEHGKNYAGFADAFHRIKRSLLMLIDLASGEARVLHRGTCQMGHLQFSPVDPNLAMFCHEGPWNLVNQRIWLIRTDSGEIFPCFRQGPDDCVGHEFWTRDGLIFFDNRRAGHDGTITSHRTQAVVAEPPPSEGQEPYIGLADAAGQVVMTWPLRQYCNHYHCDTAKGLLVGDEADDLVLIDITGSAPAISRLAHHGTSWYGQETHCHPTFGWDDRRILYASDQSGKVQLYLIDL